MDRINQFDWGVYSHFDFLGQQDSPLFRTGYLASGNIGVAVLLVIAVLLFLIQKRFRSILVCLLSSAFAVGLIQTVHWAVPRLRPEKAVDIVGPENMVGSYPASAVFLSMLGVMLIGFAVWGLTQPPWLRGSYAFLATLLTVWVCMSQFFLNLHFLTDILGAIAGAAVVGWVAYQFLEQNPPTEERSAASDATKDTSQEHAIRAK